MSTETYQLPSGEEVEKENILYVIVLYLGMISYGKWTCYCIVVLILSVCPWLVISPAVAPDIAIVSQRINDVIEVLSDFKNRRQPDRFEQSEIFCSM